MFSYMTLLSLLCIWQHVVDRTHSGIQHTDITLLLLLLSVTPSLLLQYLAPAVVTSWLLPQQLYSSQYTDETRSI